MTSNILWPLVMFSCLRAQNYNQKQKPVLCLPLSYYNNNRKYAVKCNYFCNTHTIPYTSQNHQPWLPRASSSTDSSRHVPTRVHNHHPKSNQVIHQKRTLCAILLLASARYYSLSLSLKVAAKQLLQHNDSM
jgi:hypothetical protein